METLEYAFGAFRLKPAARELLRDGAPVSTSRLSFDCIVHLLENRDRAVGRDELVAAVWGKVDVSDNHLNQVITRARRALDDSANTQSVIRTVQGFGYHWIVPVEVEQRSDTPVPSPLVDAAGPFAVPEAGGRPPPATSGRRRLGWAAGAAVLISLGAALWWRVDSSALREPRPVAADDRHDDALIVLPLELNVAKENAWLGLGAMDLIAGRLREAQLRVPPANTVLAALDGASSGAADADLEQVRTTLGGGRFVKGTISQEPKHWIVRLELEGPNGKLRTVEARESDAIRAARAVADRMLIALGHRPPQEGDAPMADIVQARLRQAQTALLTNQPKLGRDILAELPDDSRNIGEVQLLIAEIDFRSGRIDEAEKIVDTLLPRQPADADTLLRGKLMALRGNIHFRRSNFFEAGRDMDVAVQILDRTAAPLDLCDALTRRALSRMATENFDGASSDYSRARSLAEQAGDRLRLANVDAGFGRMQLERRRLDLALPYINSAIAQYESFGVVESVVLLHSALIDAYMDLLQFDESWKSSERQWALRERISDPGIALLIYNRRVRLLLALGHLDESRRLTAEAHERFAGLPPSVRRYLHDLEAATAWARDQYPDVASSVDSALQTWPRAPSFDRYAWLVLLRQRSLIALGRATPDAIEPWLPSGDDHDVSPSIRPILSAASEQEISPIFLIGRAEWAAKAADHTAAAHYYQRALQSAESRGTPAIVAHVAKSYAEWLLQRGDLEKAGELAGRVSLFARQDYGSALLRVEVFHAAKRRDAWAEALEAARSLAGERVIPAAIASL